MGIDHSNPYIHSTTILCDRDCYDLSPLKTAYKDFTFSLKLSSFYYQSEVCVPVYKNLLCCDVRCT